MRRKGWRVQEREEERERGGGRRKRRREGVTERERSDQKERDT